MISTCIQMWSKWGNEKKNAWIPEVNSLQGLPENNLVASVNYTLELSKQSQPVHIWNQYN